METQSKIHSHYPLFFWCHASEIQFNVDLHATDVEQQFFLISLCIFSMKTLDKSPHNGMGWDGGGLGGLD